MTNIEVYDNLGVTVDRYTVYDRLTGDMIGMSSEPMYPDGYNQFIGNCKIDNRFVHPAEVEGNVVLLWDEVPLQVKLAIKKRYQATNYFDNDDLGGAFA